jgi:hypothetical protein
MTCGTATLVNELVKIDVKNAASAAAVASQRAAGVKVGIAIGLIAVVTAGAGILSFDGANAPYRNFGELCYPI